MMVSLFLQTLKPLRVGTLTTLSSRLSRLMRTDLSICRPEQELDFESIATRLSDTRLPANSSRSSRSRKRTEWATEAQSHREKADQKQITNADKVAVALLSSFSVSPCL